MFHGAYLTYVIVHAAGGVHGGAPLSAREAAFQDNQAETDKLAARAVVLLQVEVNALFAEASQDVRGSGNQSNASTSQASPHPGALGMSGQWAFMLFDDRLDAFVIMLLPLVIILVLIVAVITASVSDDYSGRHIYNRDAPRRRHLASAAQSTSLAPRPARLQPKDAPQMHVLPPPSRSLNIQRPMPQPATATRAPETRHLAPARVRSDPTPAPIQLPRQASSQAVPQLSSQVAPPGGATKVLCEQLVLPRSEAWFAVPWLRFLHGPDFDLIGISGRPLLRGAVDLDPAGYRSLSISMTPPQSPVLGSISNNAGAGALTIYNSEADLFGVLTFEGKSLWTLKMEDGDLLQVQVNDATGEISVRESGTLQGIAEAVRCVESELFPAGDHVEMRLEPGADSVLVVLCILGLILFGTSTPLPQALQGLPHSP